MRALIVDDETFIRIETADLLAEAGFEVLEAWNAATAIRQLERYEGVRFLLSDVHLPGGRDGCALAQEVLTRWPGIAIVLVSGAAEECRSRVPPGVRFVAKPFSARIALQTVRELAAPR